LREVNTRPFPAVKGTEFEKAAVTRGLRFASGSRRATYESSQVLHDFLRAYPTVDRLDRLDSSPEFGNLTCAKEGPTVGAWGFGSDRR
jgi:hypothetical protein